MKKLFDFFFSKIDFIFSRFVFGNAAGTKQNIYGILELWNSRRKFTGGRVNNKSNVLAKNIDDLGFSKAKWHYDNSIISNLRNNLYNSIKKGDTFKSFDSQGNLANQRMKDAVGEKKLVRKLVNEHLKSDLFAYFQSHFKVFYPICWRQYPISNTDIKRNVYSNLWHCDSGKTSIITAFILLADVTENNGPTNIISKQDTKKALSMGYINRDNYGKSKNFFKNEADIFKCTGKAGSIFYLNTRECLHKAGEISKGHYRDVMMLTFYPIPGKKIEWDQKEITQSKSLNWYRY